MNKFVVLQAIIIAVGAMLAVIPNGSITHVAKASTCSSSFLGGAGSVSFTSSGSCAIGGAISINSGGPTGAISGDGGSNSSCSSSSTSHNFASAISSSSNGAVSCSNHSP